MRLWSRERWRQLRRRLLAPLKPVEYKIRSFCQHFVLKTVQKHGYLPANPCSTSGESGNAMLLPLLQSKRNRVDTTSPAPQAIAVDGYLLTTHPVVDYFYHAPRNLAETPRVLYGDFEPDVTAWIYANISANARVLVVGGRQGYHLLSVASRFDATGKMLTLTSNSDDAALVDLNCQTNRLRDKMVLKSIRPRELDCPGRATRKEVAQFNPTIVLIDLSADTSGVEFRADRWGVDNVHQVQGGEVVAATKRAQAGRGLFLRKVA